MENTGISSRKLCATELKRKQLGSTSDRAFRQKRRRIGSQSLSSRFADPVSPAGDDQEIAMEKSDGNISDEENTVRCEFTILKLHSVCLR